MRQEQPSNKSSIFVFKLPFSQTSIKPMLLKVLLSQFFYLKEWMPATDHLYTKFSIHTHSISHRPTLLIFSPS